MASTGPVTIRCSACQRKLSIPITASGKVVQCPCGQKLRAPNLQAAAAPATFGTEFPSSPPPTQPPLNPFQSPAHGPSHFGGSPPNELSTVISGQRILSYAVVGYLCSLPLLALANIFLEGTNEKPVVTPTFFFVLGLGVCGMFAAGCFASYGIFRMGRVLFPGSTRILYSIGVLLPAPLVGLMVMFVANSKATEYLKSKGIAVGFFGAKN